MSAARGNQALLIKFIMGDGVGVLKESKSRRRKYVCALLPWLEKNGPGSAERNGLRIRGEISATIGEKKVGQIEPANLRPDWA